MNANWKTKQVRKPSYIHEEITVLPKEVATNKVIIQSILNSEVVTNQQKGQLWQDIARKGSNCGVCVQTPDYIREKLSDMKKDFFREKQKTKQNKKTKNNNNKTNNYNNKKQINKMGNWSHTGQTIWRAIVGKDSALFSSLLKREVARPSNSNVQAPLSVRLSFGEYPLVGI